jgi:hypothetical protein
MKQLVTALIAAFAILTFGHSSAASYPTGAQSLETLSSALICAEEKKKKKKGEEEAEDEEPECD